MTTYSHAAIEWAATHPTTWSAAAFDAGAASVTPVPAPVLLTADDPRIVAGALVEVTYPSENGESVTYRHRVEAGSTARAWSVGAVKSTIPLVAVLLIEEAPDPDVDVLDAMEATYGKNSDEALADLRAAGYDVVKRADA